MLFDAIATIDDDVNGALAEGCDGGAAVAEGDLLGRLEVSKFREHRGIIAEGFWRGARVVAHEDRWCRRTTWEGKS